MSKIKKLSREIVLVAATLLCAAAVVAQLHSWVANHGALNPLQVIVAGAIIPINCFHLGVLTRVATGRRC